MSKNIVNIMNDSIMHTAAFGLTTKIMGFACGASGGAIAGAAFYAASSLIHAIATRIFNPKKNGWGEYFCNTFSLYAGLQAMKASFSLAGYQLGVNVTTTLAFKTSFVFFGAVMGVGLVVGGASIVGPKLIECIYPTQAALAEPVYL